MPSMFKRNIDDNHFFCFMPPDHASLAPFGCCFSTIFSGWMMTFMFGNAFALFYSLSGAVLSLTVMLLLKKTGKFSPVGVGAAGGVTHNIGQILCAMVVLETEKLAYYLPVLLVSGTLAGIGIGIVGGILIKRIDPERV